MDYLKEVVGSKLVAVYRPKEGDVHSLGHTDLMKIADVVDHVRDAAAPPVHSGLSLCKMQLLWLKFERYCSKDSIVGNFQGNIAVLCGVCGVVL
jgi:hypothetical protein